MNWSSLWAIALAASLATGTTLADQKKLSEMTREEIRAEVKSVCENPERMKNIIDPDNVCEFSTDNGKTWREYIPSMPSLPNGTAGIAWGWLAGLLLLLGTGAAIMRYRKKDEYVIAPNIGKKYVPTPKANSGISPKNKWENQAIDEDLLDQAMKANPKYKWLGHALEQEKNGMDTLAPFSQMETPVEEVDILIDWVTATPEENLWDWDEVEKILSEEKSRNTTNTIWTSEPIVLESDIITQPISLDANNDSFISTPDESILTPDYLDKNPDNITPIAPDSTHHQWEKTESMIEEWIREKLQSTELSSEEKEDISKTIVSVSKMLKKNIELWYWFDITDNNGSITLIAKSEWGKLYYLNTVWSIEETQNFTTDWVAKFKVLGKWYYQIVYANGKTQNIYLVKWDN